MTRRHLLLGALLVLAGCAGEQSALAPGGPDGERLRTLAVVLAAGAAAVTAIVFLLLAIALHGPDGLRQRLAGNRAVVLGGIVFPVATLTVLLGYGVWLMRETLRPAAGGEVLRVEVSGEQWWWRLAYPGPDGRPIADANELRVPAGRPVELALSSPDVIHSFWVPSLSGKVDMIPGRTNRLRFTAGRTGIYRGQCAEYCGGPHALMAFDVVVMEPAAFDGWLARQAGSARPPDEGEAARGAALFLAAGCGGCHAVRGTAAQGLVGPDLSRVGERRSIGAATLPATPENIARFIADPGAVKPGALMPPFAFLPAEDRRVIALYLAGLR